MSKEGYVPKEQRKKILFLCDDIRMTSGIATMAREIVMGTAHHFNWVNLGGSVKHFEKGKRYDLSEATNKEVGTTDASVILYPTDGYGSPEIVRQLIKLENPDAILFFTDPRYWIWLFQMEHEIRKKIPLIYLNIWDDLPYPMYNKSYYESCDALLAISKQTENINRNVLGEKLSKEKVIKYVPHGIDENIFFPITSDLPEYLTLQEFKKKLFGNKEYKFVLLYNARNIRRKCTSDLLLAWKLFVDNLPEGEAENTALVLHTQIRDENGTDLQVVKEMLCGNKDYNIIFDENKYEPKMMNLLYNSSDAVALISSNEGWGLSLTEGMMCGRPFIATVTGGMQDQMRFEDDEGNWIKFTKQFGSNHRGKYTDCGPWAFPVFPSNFSIVGSLQTPYIFDDRAEPFDIADQIKLCYDIKVNDNEVYEEVSEKAREWVTSDESMMSSRWMSKNMIEGIEETLDKFKPRKSFDIIKVEKPKQPFHYVENVIPS